MIAILMIIFLGCTLQSDFEDKQTEIATRLTELINLTQEDDLQLEQIRNTYNALDAMDDTLDTQGDTEHNTVKMKEMAAEYGEIMKKNEAVEREKSHLRFAWHKIEEVINPIKP